MRKRKQRTFLVFLLLSLGIAAVMYAAVSLTLPAQAANGSAELPAFSPSLAKDNASCLYCHGKPGQVFTLPSGEELPLTIDEDHFSASVHQDINCTDCHTDISGYPHPTLEAHNRRDVSLLLYTTCKQCHATQYDLTLDSVHQVALAGGNTNAAICTDCHNPHEQAQITDSTTGQILPEARVWIPTVCARCHSTIFDQYKSSVHGSALIGDMY